MNKGLMLLLLSQALEGDPAPAKPRTSKEILQARVEETVLLGKALFKGARRAYKAFRALALGVPIGVLPQIALWALVALLMGIL
jgi:hypothetical protein